MPRPGRVSARTDVGARVLALATEEFLRGTESIDDCFTPAFVESLRNRLKARPLNCEPEDYLASLVAFCADQKRAEVFLAGDGCIATIDRAGLVLSLKTVQWPFNEPYYLGYCLDTEKDQRLAASFRNHGSQVVLTDYSAQLNVTNDRSNAAATVQSAMSCQEMLQGWRQSIDLEHVWKLAVISDGIEQIDGIGAIDAAKQILEFRNLHGSYLKRAARLTLESWHETGHLPVDDLGLAVLTIE